MGRSSATYPGDLGSNLDKARHLSEIPMLFCTPSMSLFTKNCGLPSVHVMYVLLAYPSNLLVFFTLLLLNLLWYLTFFFSYEKLGGGKSKWAAWPIMLVFRHRVHLWSTVTYNWIRSVKVACLWCTNVRRAECYFHDKGYIPTTMKKGPYMYRNVFHN